MARNKSESNIQSLVVEFLDKSQRAEEKSKLDGNKDMRLFLEGLAEAWLEAANKLTGLLPWYVCKAHPGGSTYGDKQGYTIRCSICQKILEPPKE